MLREAISGKFVFLGENTNLCQNIVNILLISQYEYLWRAVRTLVIMLTQGHILRINILLMNTRKGEH